MGRQGGAWEVSSAASAPLPLSALPCSNLMVDHVRNMLEDIWGIE
jgi:hypothetical protein